jgi:hypothetical protein
MASSFPELDHLVDGLTSALHSAGIADGSVTVLKREANPYISTFPGEIIKLRFAERRNVRVLCKYEAGVEEGTDGHRRGIEYEAAVYSDVLRPIKLSTPKFYGGYTDPSTKQSWLFIEYVDKTWRIHKSPAPKESVPLAARWIGQFHVRAEQLAFQPFLIRYDKDYYRKWPQRTFLVTRQVHGCWPWLASLCERAVELLPLLCEGKQTVIHGEYFPKNILLHARRVCPVDWQSAAYAAGEVDLASLVCGRWGKAFTELLKREYVHARWPGGLPSDFEFRLNLAQLYWPMRFIADMDMPVTEEDVRTWVEELRAPGERLGLV